MVHNRQLTKCLFQQESFKLDLRWPEPIYMRVGYVFDLRYSTDFYDFWHP